MIVFGSIEANQQLLKDATAARIAMSDLLDGDIELDHPSVLRILGDLSPDDDANADATEILVESGITAKIARFRVEKMSGRTLCLDRADGSKMTVSR